MKISFSSAFRRLFEKNIKNDKGLEEEFWRCTQLFIENPFDRRLKTHKLSGKLKELWSFSIDYNIRIIFYFTPNNTEAVFIDIGNHDEVY